MEKEKAIKNEYDFYVTRWHGEYAVKGMNFHQAGWTFKQMIEEHPDEIIALGVSYRDEGGNCGEVDLARYKNGVVSLLEAYKTVPFLAQEESFSKIVDDLIVWIEVRNRALSEKKRAAKQEKKQAKKSNTDEKVLSIIMLGLIALTALIIAFRVITRGPEYIYGTEQRCECCGHTME